MGDVFTPRRLATALAAVVGVFVAGTVGFRLILDDGWLASFYRTVVTTSLTGLDSTPHGTGAKILTIALVLAGVTIFAYVGAIVVEAIARGILGGVWVERRRRRTIEGLRDHFIICGYGRVGRRVAEEFRKSGVDYVVLDFSEAAIAAAEEQRDLFVKGTGTEDKDLEAAGLAHARGLVACSDSDADNLYICLSARASRPDLQIVARASDSDAEKKLRLAGADRVVLPYATAGRVIANLMIKPQVAAFVNVLTSPGGADLSFEEIEVTRSCGQTGKSIRELEVLDRTGAYIVAVRRRDGAFDTRPSKETVLEEGDIVVGVGTQDEIRALEELFAPREAVAR